MSPKGRPEGEYRSAQHEGRPVSALTLQAYINHRRIGTLTDRDGIWSFSYDPEWLAAPDAYSLSPALKLQPEPHEDSSSVRTVQWYFDNLLPEEGARTLLAKDAKLDAADAFGLLAWYGAESAGSLTLLAAPPKEDERRYVALSDQDLQTRIEALPRISLAATAAKRMSLAGAQHKLAVIYRDGALFEPVGHEPSTHILKPGHTDPDYPHTVINEFFTMRLAARMRLPVPAVVRRYVPAPVYLVERFDRARTGDEVQRLHLIDACQVLNLDRRFKYQQGSVERLGELASTCTAAAAARLRIFSWLVFNVLTGNADAHLKNLSFLVTSRGLALAPGYDLLSVAVYDTPAFDKRGWPATPLAWPLRGKATFDELTREDLLEAGEALGLSREVATRLLDVQVTRIEGEAKALLREVEAENEHTLHARPELAATFSGELRCLRAIVALVIRDMVARLEAQ
ncbi:MAG: HipA domain-containing protein [Casimicrobiaceae bacterium]